MTEHAGVTAQGEATEPRAASEQPSLSEQPAASEQTVAILAPHGRDAAVAQRLLLAEGIACLIMPSLAELGMAIRVGVGAVLVTEEALIGVDRSDMQDTLAHQPEWADIPFVVLANGTGSARSMNAQQQIDLLGNVVLLSRPLHAEELLRAVRSALKARHRQYEARERMEELILRETQLRESETKFHTIANSIDQMIWSTLPDGFHDYYNDRWYKFTGVPEGSTDGEAWNGMFHPDDQERAWEVWRTSLETGQPYEIEYRLRHRDGSYRWVLGRAQAVRDEKTGAIVRWYGSCTDIHDEVLAREATVGDLTRQRDEAWNLSLDLMAVSEENGNLLVVNRAWSRLLGWTEGELLGRSIIRLVHPDDFRKTRKTFADVAEQPVTAPFECRLQHRDGSYRWFAWTASGQDGRIFASGRDVTERRKNDAALASAEAALRQSQKLEMIGQLTGGVAHDFNNLLMAIRSSLDLARRRMVPDDTVGRYLENAIAATDRGAGLTQRMLAFARQQELDIGTIEIGPTLSGMRDLLQRSLGPQIEIVVDVPEGLPQVKADTNQLEMALLNLAVNGRDAMDSVGRLTLTARATDASASRDLDPGAYVEIGVADTGEGMDETTLARAMEPFFTTKGVGKGTGLGLSMVHGLAKQSGGSFQLESRPGKGTRALIYLPVSQDEVRKPEPEAAVVPDASGTQGAKSRMTILAVDDDVLVSMGTVGMLEDLGHEVIEVHSGAKAFAIIEARDDIDLMITDHAMPGMTGAELARKVRELRPMLPIILATGYAEMPDGAAGYITAKLDKPFSDAALTRVLGEVMERVDG
ncbi:MULTISPECIES: PAS domain-containing protein [unclassified Marinovum]